MGKIETIASKVNLWTALIERIAKLANALGFEITATRVVGAILPAAGLVGALIRQSAPWYVVLVFGIFAASGLLHLYTAIVRAIAVQGVTKLTVTDAAKLCEAVEKGFYDFVEARQLEVAAYFAL